MIVTPKNTGENSLRLHTVLVVVLVKLGDFGRDIDKRYCFGVEDGRRLEAGLMMASLGDLGDDDRVSQRSREPERESHCGQCLERQEEAWGWESHVETEECVFPIWQQGRETVDTERRQCPGVRMEIGRKR